MINPRLLCRKHLLGEHGEIHKHKHNFVKHHSIKNRILLDQIEPMSMRERHDALAKEMLRRKFKHKSPYEMPDLSYLPEHERLHKVNQDNALQDLIGRCEECRKMSLTV